MFNLSMTVTGPRTKGHKKLRNFLFSPCFHETFWFSASGSARKSSKRIKQKLFLRVGFSTETFLWTRARARWERRRRKKRAVKGNFYFCEKSLISVDVSRCEWKFLLFLHATSRREGIWQEYRLALCEMKNFSLFFFEHKTFRLSSDVV